MASSLRPRCFRAIAECPTLSGSYVHMWGKGTTVGRFEFLHFAPSTVAFYALKILRCGLINAVLITMSAEVALLVLGRKKQSRVCKGVPTVGV